MDKALQEMINQVTSFGLLGIFAVLGTWSVVKLIKIAWATATAFVEAVIEDLKQRETKAVQQADKREALLLQLMKDWNEQHNELVDRVTDTMNKNTQAFQSLKEWIQRDKIKTDP